MSIQRIEMKIVDFLDELLCNGERKKLKQLLRIERGKNKKLMKENLELKHINETSMHQTWGHGQDDMRQLFEIQTASYAKILKAMFLCVSLQEMMDDYNIRTNRGEKELNNILVCIALIGQGTSFYSVLNYYMEKKVEKNEIITQEETEFYHALNAFYEDKFGEADYIIIPRIGDVFQKECMIDSENRVAEYKVVKAVYTPVFQDSIGDIKYKAFVKGE